MLGWEPGDVGLHRLKVGEILVTLQVDVVVVQGVDQPQVVVLKYIIVGGVGQFQLVFLPPQQQSFQGHAQPGVHVACFLFVKARPFLSDLGLQLLFTQGQRLVDEVPVVEQEARLRHGYNELTSWCVVHLDIDVLLLIVDNILGPLGIVGGQYDVRKVRDFVDEMGGAVGVVVPGEVPNEVAVCVDPHAPVLDEDLEPDEVDQFLNALVLLGDTAESGVDQVGVYIVRECGLVDQSKLDACFLSVVAVIVDAHPGEQSHSLLPIVPVVPHNTREAS